MNLDQTLDKKRTVKQRMTFKNSQKIINHDYYSKIY